MQDRYCLQMVACDGGCGSTSGSGTGAENLYSTEETVCGTWIDRKPIYRKVVTMKLPTPPESQLLEFDISDLNIDEMVDIRGGVCEEGLIPANSYYSSAYHVYTYYSKAGKKLVVNYSANYALKAAGFILEYTKA